MTFDIRIVHIQTTLEYYSSLKSESEMLDPIEVNTGPLHCFGDTVSYQNLWTIKTSCNASFKCPVRLIMIFLSIGK